MITAEEILKSKQHHLISVGPDTPICDALKLMNERRIGAILVVKNDEIAGIWTERDLMQDCLGDGFDARKDVIGDFMTTDLQFADHDANVFELMDQFLGKRLRHLLIRKEGKYIGVLSSGDVMRATLSEKDRELKKLNAMVSWDYYENWKWERTRVPPMLHNEEGLRVDLK